jgi:uncharacterized protein
MSSRLKTLPMTEIAEYCRRWKIRELAIFGSALRDDFEAESDVDVMVTFHKDATWSLLDHIQMQQSLEAIVRRDVDLVTRRAVEQSRNPLLRHEILSTATVVFREPDIAYATR